MRQVQIVRKKNFVGCLIPYFLFIGYPKCEATVQAEGTDYDYPNTSNTKIHNGETITVSIQDGKCSIFVLVKTSTGITQSPAYLIEEGTNDIALELVTKYSWLHGSQYILKPSNQKL